VLVVLFLSQGLHAVPVNFTWRRPENMRGWLSMAYVLRLVCRHVGCRHMMQYAAQVSPRPYISGLITRRLGICVLAFWSACSSRRYVQIAISAYATYISPKWFIWFVPFFQNKPALKTYVFIDIATNQNQYSSKVIYREKIESVYPTTMCFI